MIMTLMYWKNPGQNSWKHGWRKRGLWRKSPTFCPKTSLISMPPVAWMMHEMSLSTSTSLLFGFWYIGSLFALLSLSLPRLLRDAYYFLLRRQSAFPRYINIDIFRELSEYSIYFLSYHPSPDRLKRDFNSRSFLADIRSLSPDLRPSWNLG